MAHTQTLDEGPPLPPNLPSSPRKATLDAMVGPTGPQPTPGGGANVQRIVAERLMLADKALRDIAMVMPATAPIIDQIVEQAKMALAPIIFASEQQMGMGQPQAGAMPVPPQPMTV